MKRLSIVSFVAALLLPLTAASQDVKEANYQFKVENYQAALKIYLPAYKRDTADADINYGIGVCRTKTNSAPAQALPHLLKAESKYGQEPEFLLALAKAYFFNYKFDKARETLQKAAVKLKGNAEADMLKSYIDNAEKMVKSPIDVTFVNLGKGINSDMDDITPILTPDGEYLFYSSNRKFDTGFKEYMWDVFYSSSESGDHKKSKAASTFNTAEDELMAGVSLNGTELYYYQDAYGVERDLIATALEGNMIKGKTPLPPTINTKGIEKTACSTFTGDTLFFTSDGLGGQGGSDIFYSVRLPNGDWSAAVNLGKGVNSQYDELYPMLSADGKKFYFCSNGPKSMGGFDVFVCSIDLKNMKMGEPRNIGYPLNDVYDNLTISYTPNGDYAYVSAIKPDSYGYSDIYRVVFNEKDPMVKLYIVKLQIAKGEEKIDFGETETDLKVSVFTKGKTLFGTYNYNPASSSVNVALLPGDYVLEIEGKTIEPISMKINVPNAPGKKIETLKTIVKLKK